ncbi:MAG: hypothetical protein CVV64_14160 [Candidatus Wallbacteria bacterium HGW-Wallbacteria-1]|uniref:Uncharacterized protein n=1 Tax=Candidatus Wallbacteria bacterium HGW-Wallbacteria-1 TaxID=2013854 RepID=A0A2N1PMK3_9BACT|nr:MAG: hypothetical protein CVV64_14160 [Candidatus Wallbacteria bacterium HGW-Wallbacteria-1]
MSESIMNFSFFMKNPAVRPVLVVLIILFTFSAHFPTMAGAASNVKPADFAALVESGISDESVKNPVSIKKKSTAPTASKASRSSISKVPMSSSLLENATHITGSPSHQSPSVATSTAIGGNVSSSGNLSPATSKHLANLTRAIEIKMKQISNKYSQSGPVSDSGKINMNEKLGDRMFSADGDMFVVNSNSASRKKPALVKISVADKTFSSGNSSSHVPWAEVISSIESMPEANVNDPIIKSAVSATVKMLSSPDFQSGFVKVVEKNHNRKNNKRGFIMACGAAILVGQYLMPAINGAIAGGATAAGNSYGQGPGAYVMNTFGGAIHGAAQAVQNTMRGR